jgi:hypothetical protein
MQPLGRRSSHPATVRAESTWWNRPARSRRSPILRTVNSRCPQVLPLAKGAPDHRRMHGPARAAAALLPRHEGRPETGRHDRAWAQPELWRTGSDHDVRLLDRSPWMRPPPGRSWPSARVPAGSTSWNRWARSWTTRTLRTSGTRVTPRSHTAPVSRCGSRERSPNSRDTRRTHSRPRTTASNDSSARAPS